MAEVEEQSISVPTQSAPVAVFKKRGNKTNFRKRPATPPPDSGSDSDSEYSSEDESGHRVKRRRKGGLMTTSAASKTSNYNHLEDTKFAASKDASIQTTDDATKQSNWQELDAGSALSAQNLLGNTKAKRVSDAADGSYKGTSNYQTFIQKNPNAPDRKVGPVKSAANVRTITVTDFAPDVCKDYKQTGFCGFGDSCKFLHAREDYKQGWELDRDWEINTKGKKVAGRTVASANRSGNPENDEEAEDEMLESIPFACIICKEPYKDPIVTKCGHYFCERCALQRYRKTPNCAACGEGTGGMFNTAKNLRKLLDKKRERARHRREKAREAGEDVSDSDEES